MDQSSGGRRGDAHCNLLFFVCDRCGRTTDQGAADDMPDTCDSCWLAAHDPAFAKQHTHDDN